MIYLLTITLGLCSCYFALFLILPLLFQKEIGKINKRSFFSVFIIVGLSLFVYYLNFIIPDFEIANRVLHAFGGGFLASLVCFLVVKDGKFSITKFQFFIFTLLLVTFLGVMNEIAEFFLQNYTSMIMAKNINDTWLDLISNLFGITIAGVSFIPFINNNKKISLVLKEHF